MVAWHRRLLGSLATLVGLASGCGGPGAPGAPEGGASSGSGGSTSQECGDYFGAIVGGGCDGVVPPAAELARERLRFTILCDEELALPGSGLMASALEACAVAVQSAGACRASDQATNACKLSVPGSRAAGAACFGNQQCQSGQCSRTIDAGVEPGCGTCAAALAVGQTCAAGPSCTAGAACDTTKTPPTCVAISIGDVGASCASPAVICKTGLYCSLDGPAPVCAAAKGAGAACNGNVECANPLVCDGMPTTCQNPQPAGAACVGEDCAAGLTCATQSTHTCSTFTWAAAGQPCSDTALCLVGGCSFQGSTGTCRMVIPDGQPCTWDSTTAICDKFAQCMNGTCVLAPLQCN
jgi:hypothetical protein